MKANHKLRGDIMQQARDTTKIINKVAFPKIQPALFSTALSGVKPAGRES